MHRRGSYSTAPAELRIRFTRPQEPFILYIRPLYVCQRFTRVYNLASRVHEFDRNRLAKKEKKRKERGGRGESARERLGEPRRMEWKKSWEREKRWNAQRCPGFLALSVWNYFDPEVWRFLLSGGSLGYQAERQEEFTGNFTPVQLPERKRGGLILKSPGFGSTEARAVHRHFRRSWTSLAVHRALRFSLPSFILLPSLPLAPSRSPRFSLPVRRLALSSFFFRNKPRFASPRPGD